MRPDLDGALVEEAMQRYLTPAQRRELARLFAECAIALAEHRAARWAASAASSPGLGGSEPGREGQRA